MEAKDFVAFLAMMKWSDAEAMRQLGIGSHNTVASYKQNGGPLWLGLACAALARGLSPWKANLVAVYAFQVWNINAGEYLTSPTKRTPDAIARIGGVHIEGTLEMVPPELVDAEGVYVKR